jgi:hypothetical protein
MYHSLDVRRKLRSPQGRFCKHSEGSKYYVTQGRTTRELSFQIFPFLLLLFLANLQSTLQWSNK